MGEQRSVLAIPEVNEGAECPRADARAPDALVFLEETCKRQGQGRVPGSKPAARFLRQPLAVLVESRYDGVRLALARASDEAVNAETVGTSQLHEQLGVPHNPQQRTCRYGQGVWASGAHFLARIGVPRVRRM